jgi:hypothetical protein
MSEMKILICKCGNEKEISTCVDIEWYRCDVCMRTGHWVEPEDYVKEVKSKCSVPMWDGFGFPAGNCGKDAFGKRTKEGLNRFNGHAPRWVCYNHGGPQCPGIEIEEGVFSGCDQSGGDCPTCGN